MTCSVAFEMKPSERATKQLYAYMIHIGSQITVKALKKGKVVDLMAVYGFTVNYEKRSSSLYKLSVDF